MTLQPFNYPKQPHVRKHGPFGYQDYESYRAWLRDEFAFRCVFCLHRERWAIAQGVWAIDHFLPQNLYPQGLLDYENLLYVCCRCNGAKGDKILPNPCQVALGECLQVRPDGSIVALNEDGARFISRLRLNRADNVRFRRLIIETVAYLAQNNPVLFTAWMSYPDDLPDLSKLRPPDNTRPAGVANSFYEQRKRGTLPVTY